MNMAEIKGASLMASGDLYVLAYVHHMYQTAQSDAAR